MKQRVFSLAEAKSVGNKIGVNWTKIDPEQLRVGMNIELEHGTENIETNITNDDAIMAGKIALAHLNERSDYYKLLVELEAGPEFNRDF